MALFYVPSRLYFDPLAIRGKGWSRYRITPRQRGRVSRLGRRGNQAPVNHRAEPEPSTTKTDTMNTQQLTLTQFNKLAKGKRLFVNWVYSKDDSGYIEIKKAEFPRFTQEVKLIEVRHAPGTDAVYVDELIF